MPQEHVSIAFLDGDGIGPEVGPWAKRVFETSNEVLDRRVFEITDYPYNADYYLQHGRAWPEGEAERLAHEHHAAFLIALGRKDVGMKHAVEIILKGFRGHEAWKTNVNHRPVELLHPTLAPLLQRGPFHFELRTLTEEDETIREEGRNPGSEEEEVIVTETHSVEAFRKKLESAVLAARMSISGERKVIVVHKANVLNNSHGPWVDEKDGVRTEVQRSNPDVEIQEKLMDAFLDQLVRDPASVPQYIVTDLSFGTVLQRALRALTEGERKVTPEGYQSLIRRENTEGMYYRGGGIEGVGDERIGTQIGKQTRKMIAENIKSTITAAREQGLNAITVLHLDDAHPQAYGLWKRVAIELCSAENIAVDFMHAGDYVAALIRDPGEIHGRVFAADNVLGDICGDAAAAVVGGMSIPATSSFNTTRPPKKRRRFYEPLHGSGLDRVGQQSASPAASMLTAELVLQDYGYGEISVLVRQALQDIFGQGFRTTSHPSGTLTTDQFGQKIIDRFLELAA